jgi:hypothetical protein
MIAKIFFGAADRSRTALTNPSYLDRAFRRPRGPEKWRSQQIDFLDRGLLDDLGLRPVRGYADSRRLLGDL